MQVADSAPLHAMWASVAAAWDEHADFVEARAAGVTERLLELARPRRGDRVLELACGAGGAGRTAAGLVAPGGEVVLSDVVPEMIEFAAARAAGLPNVSTRVLDLERIDEPDAAYDVVLCREGLMFALDPEAAAREIRRVLRPGGRVALAVWGPRERNPWLGLLLDAASEQLGMPFPPPGVPGPFALEDAERLAGLLTGAGLADVAVTELAVPSRTASVEEWWTRTLALAGPLSRVVASLPPEDRRELRERAERAAAPYVNGAGLELPGVTLLASARA
jgi:ubiquinone/menaquinone biosynthesis C-methylase UbiE